ncbi:hypothetical protein HK101_011771 [Irineochytrium annulatum]|nr:hypothetical protein HK101_011771 [Irineochytrium annulatum]
MRRLRDHAESRSPVAGALGEEEEAGISARAQAAAAAAARGPTPEDSGMILDMLSRLMRAQDFGAGVEGLEMTVLARALRDTHGGGGTFGGDEDDFGGLHIGGSSGAFYGGGFGEEEDDEQAATYESLLALSEQLGPAVPRGATEWDIRQLEVKKLTEEDVRVSELERNKEEAAHKCAICLETFTAGEEVMVVRGCKHWFHQDCGAQWFRTSRRCPTCRVDFTELQP